MRNIFQDTDALLPAALKQMGGCMKKSPFIVLFCLLCLFSALNVNAQGSNDTVTVSPQKPTFLDSLHFDLYNASRCCCTRYYSKNVSVTDTTIMLSFQYDDSLCMLCDCLVAGNHTQFACGSQKAGKYGIYKAESMYCPPGTVCPLGPVMIKRVGEVTVYAPTSAVIETHPSVAHSTRASVKAQNGIMYSLDGKVLTARRHPGIAIYKEGQAGTTKIILQYSK